MPVLSESIYLAACGSTGCKRLLFNAPSCLCSLYFHNILCACYALFNLVVVTV